MHANEEHPSFVVTRGREQPPLDYGPQRLHYIHSVGIPQAYLTLFSILQGIVFGIVLTAFPLPKAIAWSAVWLFVLQQYLYLPYLISLALLIQIWLHQISVTLTGGWPHTFPQVSLIVLLTLFEVLTVRNIPVLSMWLFFLGWTNIVGGSIVRRTGKMHHSDDFDEGPAFQQYGVYLTRSETRRGLHYIIVGVSFLVLALGHEWWMALLRHLEPSLTIFVPWGLYIYVAASLVIMIITRARRSRKGREIRAFMYASTDLTLSPEGVIRYDKKKSREASVISARAQQEASLPHPEIRQQGSPYRLVGIVVVTHIIVLIMLRWIMQRKLSSRK